MHILRRTQSFTEDVIELRTAGAGGPGGRPGGAHLRAHVAADDDASGFGIVFGGGMARQVGTGTGLQTERERIA